MKLPLELCIVWVFLSQLAIVQCAPTATTEEQQSGEEELVSTSEPKIFEHNNPVVSIRCRILPLPQNGKCVEGSCMTAQFTVANVQACLDNSEGGCTASHGGFVEGICKKHTCISKHGQRDMANQDCLGNTD